MKEKKKYHNGYSLKAVIWLVLSQKPPAIIQIHVIFNFIILDASHWSSSSFFIKRTFNLRSFLLNDNFCSIEFSV